MILLDTHIWIWWTSDISKLDVKFIEIIKENGKNEICLSIIQFGN